jgi:ABC-type uncharacterized transport system auxiliary subunit
MGLALGTCNALTQPYPDRATYAIDPGQPEKVATSAGALALRVMPTRVAKPYDSQLFNYKIGATKFTQDYYNGFVAPPDRLLGPQLVEWLNDSGAVKYAQPAGTTLDCNANLETQVSALYADRTTKQAILELRAFVIADRLGPTEVLMQKVYRESEPLGNESAEELVKAWGVAYGKILKQLAADVAGISVAPATMPER